MQWIVAALLALPVLGQENPEKDLGRVGQCIFVTSEQEQFDGPKRISSAMNGECRPWKKLTASGHFRVDAGCTMKVYPKRGCKGPPLKLLDARSSSTSKTRLMTHLDDFGLEDWGKSSKCTCTGASLAAKDEGEAEEGGADEEPLALAQVAAGEDTEDEVEENDEDEDEDGEEEEDEAELWPVNGEMNGLKDHRRRRHVKYEGSAACAWLFFNNADFRRHHFAWEQRASKNECVESRKGKPYLPGKRQGSGYALADPNCQVRFYSKPGCQGDSVRFTPRGSEYRPYGSSRILSEFKYLGSDPGWNNRILSTKCLCKN